MNYLLGAFKSKTILFNVLMLALGILGVLSQNHALNPTIVADITGIGNIFLRFITTGSLADKVN